MSRKAFLAGVPVLLNFCASENFKDVKKIYWIEMNDISKGKITSMNYDDNLKMSNLISKFFGYELVKTRVYNFDSTANNKYNFDFIDDLPIENGDIVSENVTMYQSKKFAKTHIHLFPEGALTYNQLHNLKKVFLNYPMTGPIRKLYKKFKRRDQFLIDRQWLIPDYLNISKKLVKYMSEYSVLSYKNINKNNDLFFNFLDQKFQLKEFIGEKKIYIHPIQVPYPIKQYQEWLNLIKQNTFPIEIIIKRHPTDQRDYGDTFNDCKLFNSFSNSIPLEVFFSLANVYYVGYHSTTLLNLDPNRVKIIPPPNKEIMNTKMFYPGLSGLFVNKWKKHWEN